MKAVVAVDKDWGIGYGGRLLERIPEDMRFLKNITIGKVVVMGRATFESLPGSQPLKDRTNIVLTSGKDYFHPGIIICRSLEAFFKSVSGYNAEDVFILGGARVYSELLPYCSEAYVTKFEKSHPADCFFPNLDRDNSWTPELISGDLQHGDFIYRRIRYVNGNTEKIPCFNS